MQAHAGVAVRCTNVPGDGLLHPVALISIAVLIVNDHFLKAAYPGLITGKLSDFAGLIFFPLFLISLFEVVASAVSSGRKVAGRRSVVAACALTATLFGAIKTIEPANALISILMGVGQSAISGAPSASPVLLVMDASDLIAIPAVLVALAIACKRIAIDV